jgi:hypothetical protein
MQSKILEHKLLVKKKDDTIVDLTSKSIEYNRVGKVLDAFYVGEDMTMRVDLISKVAYGIEDEWDLICKFNGISNPFSVDENELIFIPDLSFMYESIVNPEVVDIDADIRNQYYDSSKISEIDTKKTEYDKLIQKIQENGPLGININTYSLPPNVSEPGDREGRIDANGVIFGDYVTK